jgi:hypothetical protein
MSTSYDDPREPFIIRGILISLASLFELCKGLQLVFQGDGAFKNKSVPGDRATGYDGADDKKIYIADANFFEDCIGEIKDANPQLSNAVWILNNHFQRKISIPNLLDKLIYPSPDISRVVGKAELTDSIENFTLDFQEVIDLSSLLKSSFRNRRSHKKLRDVTDKSYDDYQHAIMSRFLHLVNKCSDCPKSKDWWTRGPQGDAMIIYHEEEFKRLTEQVFSRFGKPPLQSLPDEIDIHPAYQSDTKQGIGLPANDVAWSISKADLYEIVDFIRETHDESSSRFAWLEEQISLLVADNAEDIKSTLLRPWMNKDIEAILSLVSSRSADQAGETESSNSSEEEKKAGAEDTHSNRNYVIDNFTTTPMQHLEKLYSRCSALRNEIRNNLHQINPRFEYYHCVLQSNVVLPALRLGVCNYDQLKETEAFQARIVKLNKSFMLDIQEEKYREEIDRLLSQNPLTYLPDKSLQ